MENLKLKFDNALVVIISMISITIMKNHFSELVSNLISVTLGYIVAMCMGLVSFEPIAQANWLGFQQTLLLTFLHFQFFL